MLRWEVSLPLSPVGLTAALNNDGVSGCIHSPAGDALATLRACDAGDVRPRARHVDD
jgi:hypothetical protein